MVIVSPVIVDESAIGLEHFAGIDAEVVTMILLKQILVILMVGEDLSKEVVS